MKINIPYLSPETNRHGNEVLFVRRFGRRIRIKEKPGTEEFNAAYAAALARLAEHAPLPTVKGSGRSPAKTGTFRWLGQRYFASVEFRKLAAQSQKNRRSVIEACFEEPLSEKHPVPMGDCPLVNMTALKVKRLRDLKQDQPGAMNNRKKYLGAMFSWAVENELMKANPARDVKRISYATDGFHTWTEDEIEQFAARHPVGTKAMLALGLLLMLGVRGEDVVTLGRQHRTKPRAET